MEKNSDSDSQMFLIFAGVVIVFFILPMLYAAHARSINAPFIALTKFQLKAFLPFSEEARKLWLELVSRDPGTLTWENITVILRYSGEWIRWPYALILFLLGGLAVLYGRTADLTRRFSMDSLLKNNAEQFPCLRPVVDRGKYLLSPESRDSGPWRIARTPAQFCLENGLLVDRENKPVPAGKALKNGMPDENLKAYGAMEFSKENATKVLTEQLGNKFDCLLLYSECRFILAAAFMAYAEGDKKSCMDILDAVSCSYSEENGICSVNLLEQEDFLEKAESLIMKHRTVLKDPLLLRHAAFELPWFMALLTRARQKGVLACSQFLWLRPLDRPLWYALNQCGGNTAWAEGLAAWAHYAAEEKAGTSLNKPHIAKAVHSLREALAEQGWLIDNTPHEPDRSYAVAEDDPYDANEDEALANEQ